MSNIYNYDLFISCTSEDKDSAHLLSRKLRELDFFAWFDVPKVEEDSSFIEKFREAMETSAVGVLLLGASGKVPCANDSVWSAIHSKLEHINSAFRIIIVTLPGVHPDAAGTLTCLTKTQPINTRQRWTVIHCKESLNEKEVIDELVLRIRGVDPNDQSECVQRVFRKAVRVRAQNALNVDWHKLVSDLYAAPFEALEQRDEALPQPNKTQTSMGIADTSGWKHTKQTRSNDTARLTRFRGSAPSPKPNLQGGSTTIPSPQQNYRARQGLQHNRQSWEGVPPVYAPRLSGGAKMAAGMLMLLVACLGYLCKSILIPDGKGVLQVRTGTVLPNTNSAPINFADAPRNSKQDEKTQARKTNDALGTQQAPIRPSLTKRGEVASAINLPTPAAVDIPVIKLEAVEPLDAAKSAEISKMEEFYFRESHNLYEGQLWAKLATIKLIYVTLNSEGIDKGAESPVLAMFIERLEKHGIRASAKKEDQYHADVVAKLQFGPKEIESRSVFVELFDKMDSCIYSEDARLRFIPSNKNDLLMQLCRSSDQLGDKVCSAIRKASVAVGNHSSS